MNRRSMLGGSAALLAAGALTTSPAGEVVNPDAVLIAACAACAAFDAEHRELWDFGDLVDAETTRLSEPIYARMGDALDVMEEHHATTAEGILARAQTLALHAGHGAYSLDVDHSTNSGRLLVYLLRDAMALSGLPVWPELLDGEIMPNGRRREV